MMNGGESFDILRRSHGLYVTENLTGEMEGLVVHAALDNVTSVDMRGWKC
jgi:hypothetical protein